MPLGMVRLVGRQPPGVVVGELDHHGRDGWKIRSSHLDSGRGLAEDTGVPRRTKARWRF